MTLATRPVVVASSGPADFRTILGAVHGAPPGAQIHVRPGTYEESIPVSRDLVIEGDGPPGSVIIRAPNACIAVGGGTVTLRGLTIRQDDTKPGRFGRLLGHGGDADAPSPKSVPPRVAAISVNGGHLVVDGCAISAVTGAAIGAGGAPTTPRTLEVRGSRFHRMTGGIAVLDGMVATIDDTEFDEWVLDAVWVKGPASRIDLRRCRFHDGEGQAVYLDAGATAVIEDTSITAVKAGVFIADPETEALIRASTFEHCTGFGVGVRAGARAVLDGNSVTDSKIGFRMFGAGTRVEISGGRLQDNAESLSVSDGAQVTADHLEITGSRVGVVGATRGTTLTLTDCRIAASTEFGVKVGGGASLVVERGVLVGNKLGLFAGEGGTEVTVRGATVHGQAGPGISIGIGARGTIESSDVYENDYPGIATVGGTVHVLENRVHDNRSNGIAVRDGADAVVEGNEVWGNLLPAITVVGARTKARVRDNTVRDNTGQGIYVYQCAEAVISDNRLADNGGAAITVSDKGSTATVLRNRVERGQGAGIWVADAAKATLEANEVRGPAGPGILVDNRAIVEAVDNVVEGATCGVLVNAAGGVFTRNRLLGNAAGSWLLIDQTRFEKDGNDEDALPVPAWTVAHLDPTKYPAFAYRVGLEVGVEPRRVGELASALALLDLATRLDAQPPAAWSTLIHEHVEAERLAHGGASQVVDGATEDSQAVREHIVAHLEAADRVGVGRPSRPTPIPGVLETLSVQGPSGAGTPLTRWESVGAIDELFELGERHIRVGLRVSDLPRSILDARAYLIEGPYSGSAALLHLADWCPQVLGSYGALALVGNAERLIVVPVEDTSILYQLPGLVGGAAGAWLTATWKLRPVLAWLSPDRVDLFEIEFGPDDAVTSVRAPADLAMLLARLPEPAERIPAGWETELGLTREQSLRLLPIVRLELLRRVTEDLAQLPVLNPRALVDIGSIGRDRPQATWTDEVRKYFDLIVNDRRALDRLTGGAPYDEVRPHLWIQIEHAGSGSPAALRRPVVDGLASVLMLQAPTARKRYVPRTLLAAWGVTEAHLWDDAAANMLAGRIVIKEDVGPVRKYGVADHEAEALGLFLHRLPDACPNGYILAFIHKGAAHAMRIDDAGAIGNLGRFGAFVADIYAKAAAFNDELSAHVLWLGPDGTLVDLFDARTGPTGKPPAAFNDLVTRLGLRP